MKTTILKPTAYNRLIHSQAQINQSIILFYTFTHIMLLVIICSVKLTYFLTFSVHTKNNPMDAVLFSYKSYNMLQHFINLFIIIGICVNASVQFTCFTASFVMVRSIMYAITITDLQTTTSALFVLLNKNKQI